MTLTCPACRKLNEPASETCSRCGCDLSALCAVAEGAHRHCVAAADALRRGQWAAALECADRSWTLRHTPAAARIAFLSATTLGQTDEAIRWHRCAALAGDRDHSPQPSAL